jgi:dihydroflavonol-4-reductase
MPRAFLTGATGFVGGAVMRELLRCGWTVRALIRPRADLRNLDAAESGADGRLERWGGDLGDAPALETALRGCDVLFHVAARYSLWNPSAEGIYRDNVEGTRNILEAARRAGVAKVVYTSTVGTIHIPKDGAPGDERRRAALEEVRGHYKRSKWMAEDVARGFAREGLPLVIVHPSAPVGAADLKPTPTGKMVVDFLRGKVLAYLDTGLNVVDVDDVARGHLLAADSGVHGEGYILGAENLSLIEIFRGLEELTGIRAPRLRLPGAVLGPLSLASEAFARVIRRPPLIPWEAAAMARKRMYFASVKAMDALGYRPGPAKRALVRAVLWFYENGYARPRHAGVLPRLRELALAMESSHAPAS